MEHALQADAEAEAVGKETGFWRRPAGWLAEKRLGRGFWVFFTAAFFFDFGFAVYFFLFNLFLVDLHFDERAIGYVGGALTLGSVAGTLPAGFLAKRFGLKPLLLVCFVAAPVMGVLRTMVGLQWMQIALGFLGGLAMCLWGVCFSPALAQLTTERNRASAFGLIFSVSIGTSAFGGLICGYLPQWLRMSGIVMEPADVKRWILLVSCGIAAVGLIPALLLRFPSHKEEAEAETVKKKWKMHPFLMRFLPSMALWTAVLASFTPFANVYLTRDLRIPLGQIGLIFFTAQVVQFAMGLLTPVLFRRFGLVNGIVMTQVATAVALACLAGTQQRGLAVAIYLSFSAAQWMSSPGLYNLLMSKTPRAEQSTASAMTMFSNALLQSGATAVTGGLFVRFGYPRVLVGIAVVAVMTAMLFRFVVAPASDVEMVS